MLKQIWPVIFIESLDYGSQTILVRPHRVVGSTVLSFLEATRHEKGPPDFGPSCRRQAAHNRTDSAPLGQGDVIEVQRACRWHTICHRQDDLSYQAPDGSRRGRHDNLV